MPSPQDELLARELGKVGSLGGQITGSDAIGAGGSLGARIAAQFLPTEQFQQQIALEKDITTVLTQLISFMSSEGRVASDAEVGTSQHPKVSAVLGSGFLGMNPTIVHVEVVNSTESSCSLLATGAAKEGLIKQKSAEKAVRKVVQFLEALD